MFPDVRRRPSEARRGSNVKISEVPKASDILKLKPRSASPPPTAPSLQSQEKLVIHRKRLSLPPRPSSRERRVSFINELHSDVAKIRSGKGLQAPLNLNQPSKTTTASWPIGATYSDDFNYFPRRQTDPSENRPPRAPKRMYPKSVPKARTTTPIAAPKQPKFPKQHVLTPGECRDRRRREIESLKDMFEGLEYYDNRLAGTGINSGAGRRAGVGETIKFDRGLYKFKMKNGEVRMMKPERFRCRSSVELERDIPKTSDKGLEKAREVRELYQKSQEIMDAVHSSKHLDQIRAIMANWHYSLPIRLIQCWRGKLNRAKRRTKSILGHCKPGASHHDFMRETCRWCFFGSVLIVLHNWTLNMTEMARQVQLQMERQAKQLQIELEQEARSFLDVLVGERDKKGQITKSMTVMQARQVAVEQPKHLRPEWAKLLMWLAHGRTIQEYDPQSSGLLTLSQIASAMGEFRKCGWKYDGILW